jgi:hypothetical protein
MISPETRVQIRRYFYAEHWKIGTIATALDVHPDTVRRAIEVERFQHAEPLRPSPLFVRGRSACPSLGRQGFPSATVAHRQGNLTSGNPIKFWIGVIRPEWAGCLRRRDGDYKTLVVAKAGGDMPWVLLLRRERHLDSSLYFHGAAIQQGRLVLPSSDRIYSRRNQRVGSGQWIDL